MIMISVLPGSSSFVYANWYQMWIIKLGADGTQDDVLAVFNERKLTGIENQTYVGVFKVESLSGSGWHPNYLAGEVSNEIADDERLFGASN